MDSEQMREATSIAAEAVSDKIGEFEGKDPRYVDEDGDYSSYRNDKGDDISVFAYNTGSEYKNPITGDISKPGTEVSVIKKAHYQGQASHLNLITLEILII